MDSLRRREAPTAGSSKHVANLRNLRKEPPRSLPPRQNTPESYPPARQADFSYGNFSGQRDAVPPISDLGDYETHIGEKTKEQSGKKTRMVFSVASFILIAIFAAAIGWYEFTSDDNSLEKLLSKNNTKEGDKLAAEKQANANNSAASKTAQNQAVQQETVEQNPGNANIGTTEPQKTEESGEKKTFENREVSLEYPAEYSLEENNGQITATKSEAMWRMKVYGNKDKKELKAWFDEYFSGKDISDCLESDPATLKIASLTTKQMKPSATDKKCEGEGYYALNSDKTKVVRVRLDKADETEANKILSTFKFVK